MNPPCFFGVSSGLPVVSPSSPPDSHGVGSISSVMCTQRTGASAASSPVSSSRSMSWTSRWTVSTARLLVLDDLLPGLGEHRADDRLDLGELLRARDERRRELNHRVATVVGAADEPPLVQLAREEAAQQLLGLLVAEALLGLLVLHQLDRVEVAGASHVAHDRKVLLQALEHGAELALVLAHPAAEIILLEDVEVGHRHRGGHRMAAEREPVGEHARARGEGLEDLVRGDHGSHRRVRRGDALRGGDQVRLVAVALAAEVVADASPGADHLVGDEEHAVLVADLAHALEVALRRREAATRVLHRLEDHRRHRVRSLELDPLGDLLGGIEPLGVAVAVGVGHVGAAYRQRLEHAADGADPGGDERAHRGAVVRGLARDDLVAAALPTGAVVLAAQLDRALHGLRAAGGEEDAVEVARRELRDARGQLDRERVGEGPVGVEAKFLGLARRGLAEFCAAVAGVDAEEGGEAIEVLVAALVPDVAALAAHDDRQLVVLVRAHAREVHPEMALGQLLQTTALGLLGLRRAFEPSSHPLTLSFSPSDWTLRTTVAPGGKRNKGTMGQRTPIRDVQSVQLTSPFFGHLLLALAGMRP